MKFFMLLHTAERLKRNFSYFCTLQKDKKRFPRMAKVVFQRVWHFRAWRKSFPEGFGISALGESHFPKGLAFPRLAKVVSRRVWHFRARRKSFPERFGISAPGGSRFPNGLAFPRLAKVVSRKV